MEAANSVQNEELKGGGNVKEGEAILYSESF